jgi:predicted nucleotidyltransferase
MRLTDEQIEVIRQLAQKVAGSQSRVRVFGSRLDDTARGGDLDLLLELPEPVNNPALIAATLSAQVSRAMHGRKVDVLLSAPNLMLGTRSVDPGKCTELDRLVHLYSWHHYSCLGWPHPLPENQKCNRG